MASLKDLILQLSPEQQHYIARLVASMPESEGGLGMSLKNTAEQRAKALGFDYDSDLFHGVEGEFKGQEFNPEILQSRDYGWFGSGVYLTSDPDSASAYADPLSKDKFIGQHVMPVVARKGKIFNYENANPLPEGPALNEFNRALDELGYNTVEVPNEYADPKYATNHETVIRNPKNVRSKFAAFNPWLKESSNLLASHPLASVGAGLAATGGLSGMAKEYLSQPMYQGPEMARVSKYTGVYPITRLENLKNTLSALPVTGEILAGAEGLQAASEGKWGEAGLGALGALPMMGGIFAGPRSSKADLAMLTKAKQLTKSGTDREKVWQETGWFQAPWDQKWRYEIPDVDMAPQEKTGWLNQFRLGPSIQQTDVGSAYSHPELFKAYPDIAEMELYADPNISSKAEYIPDVLGQTEAVSLNIDRPGEIAKTRRYLAEMREPSHSNYWRKQLEEEGLGSDREAIKDQLQYMQGMKRGLAELQAGKIWPSINEENVRSSLLHELQHAIQEREGFARGGSADEFLRGGPINPKTGQQYTIDEAQDMYKRMGGEVEARMTQKRMKYSPLYRKFIHPLRSIEDTYPLESIYDPKGIAGLMTK